MIGEEKPTLSESISENVRAVAPVKIVLQTTVPQLSVPVEVGYWVLSNLDKLDGFHKSSNPPARLLNFVASSSSGAV
ncbi:MAG: hypothetical protein ACP5E4_04540, partial [Candidatus Aenigmatarchaeota archaeon]